eukprot:GDKJ01028003.1.p1 GENE.GDKJ01028003.1~~GDKJ01028003.1.p1  ORF type:complete len:834 (+),score=92.87 GDKJ01028003.1:222-2504(+)
MNLTTAMIFSDHLVSLFESVFPLIRTHFIEKFNMFETGFKLELNKGVFDRNLCGRLLGVDNYFSESCKLDERQVKLKLSGLTHGCFFRSLFISVFSKIRRRLASDIFKTDELNRFEGNLLLGFKETPFIRVSEPADLIHLFCEEEVNIIMSQISRLHVGQHFVRSCLEEWYHERYNPDIESYFLPIRKNNDETKKETLYDTCMRLRKKIPPDQVERVLIFVSVMLSEVNKTINSNAFQSRMRDTFKFIENPMNRRDRQISTILEKSFDAVGTLGDRVVSKYQSFPKLFPEDLSVMRTLLSFLSLCNHPLAHIYPPNQHPLFSYLDPNTLPIPTENKLNAVDKSMKLGGTIESTLLPAANVLKRLLIPCAIVMFRRIQNLSLNHTPHCSSVILAWFEIALNDIYKKTVNTYGKNISDSSFIDEAAFSIRRSLSFTEEQLCDVERLMRVFVTYPCTLRCHNLHKEKAVNQPNDILLRVVTDNDPKLAVIDFRNDRMLYQQKNEALPNGYYSLFGVLYFKLLKTCKETQKYALSQEGINVGDMLLTVKETNNANGVLVGSERRECAEAVALTGCHDVCLLEISRDCKRYSVTDIVNSKQVKHALEYKCGRMIDSGHHINKVLLKISKAGLYEFDRLFWLCLAAPSISKINHVVLNELSLIDHEKITKVKNNKYNCDIKALLFLLSCTSVKMGVLTFETLSDLSYNFVTAPFNQPINNPLHYLKTDQRHMILKDVSIFDEDVTKVGDRDDLRAVENESTCCVIM